MKTILFIITAFTSMTACESTKQHSDTSTPVVQTLEQANLSDKLKEKDVVVVDVRTPEEVAEGYISGASHFINFYGDDFQTKIKSLDSTKTYVMYCRSGGRSGKAAQFMIDNGFKNVFNLAGGISSYSGEVAK
ncbi:MAG: rhodanese-like domain-containing protein [Bacteroidetes bacterium]|mgnify:FL=1|jgi:rhodanese-related sulfurtransferase|nr:rhodanese-like domain-containing protein [Bacteroidota bacterium]